MIIVLIVKPDFPAFLALYSPMYYYKCTKNTKRSLLNAKCIWRKRVCTVTFVIHFLIFCHLNSVTNEKTDRYCNIYIILYCTLNNINNKKVMAQCVYI